MISSALGLLLTLVVAGLYLSNKETYRAVNQSDRLMENARFALNLLARDIRLSDHWGGGEAGDISGNPSVTDDCSANYITTGPTIATQKQGINGYEGGVTIPIELAGCIKNLSDYVQQTDILVVRHAGTNPLPSTDPGGGAPWVGDTDNQNRLFVRSAVGRIGQLLKGVNISSGSDSNGTYNYPYEAYVYFIRPCNVKSGTYCASTDDGGRPIPTLTRVKLDDSTTMVQEALIEGVENMQVEYGIDTDNDNFANTYDTANNIIANDQWEDVISVRISLLMRATDPETGYVSANSYSLAGDFSVPAADDNYRRKVFSRVFQIRNRSRS
jgi:Tfp pilus assembly protein PilW